MDNVVLIQFRNNYLDFQYYVDTVFVSKNIPLYELSNKEIDAILNECNEYHSEVAFFKNVKTQIKDELVRRRKSKILYLKEKIHG